MTNGPVKLIRPFRERLERLARRLGLRTSADDRDTDLVVYIKQKSRHPRLLRAA
jgi:hypothetical protein